MSKPGRKSGVSFLSTEERFEFYVNREGGWPDFTDRFVRVTIADGQCWSWGASHNKAGYAKFSVNGEMLYAHRYSYECNVGPIDAGAVIDHLCRNHGCVNPRHVEPVPQRENYARGLKGVAAKTHCPSNHAYEGANVKYNKRGYRSCRTCTNEKQNARYALKGHR